MSVDQATEIRSHIPDRTAASSSSDSQGPTGTLLSILRNKVENPAFDSQQKAAGAREQSAPKPATGLLQVLTRSRASDALLGPLGLLGASWAVS